MKPRNNATFKPKSILCLPVITFVCFQATPALQAEQWANVGTTPLPAANAVVNYNWDDTANWNPASIPNAIGASALFDINILNNGPSATPAGTNTQLQATMRINLNVATTVGNLTMGDTSSAGSPSFHGNGFYNLVNGTAGSLTFDVATGNATLQKSGGSGSTDNISATITLNDPLVADIRSGAIEVGTTAAGPLGLISGAVGITRAAGVTSPPVPTTTGGNLILSNPGNSYTGDTIIEHGTLSARLSGDILVSTNSNFGNSANPIVLGTADTLATSNGSSILNFIATADATNYTVARGLDLSAAFTTGQTARQTINFNGNLYNFNPAGGLNTNKLILSGPITIGTRNIQIGVARSGMTLEITGDISGTNPAGNDAIRFNNFPNPVNADGQGAGTIRLSNLNRTFSAVTGVVSGTLVVDGVVGALNTDSPVGQKQVDLNIGSGGNILGGANFAANAAVGLDTSADTTRGLFLANDTNSYARNIALGAGSSVTATGVTGATTGSSAIPAVYGLNNAAAATDQSRVNVINGYKLGGLNTTGTVTFSGNVTSGTMQVGNTNTNNTIDVGINLALMAATGGTTVFSGVISDTSNGTLPIRPSVTRVTVNQFRNHPNLDGNNGTIIGADGTKDTAANALIGTATGGTVVVSGANTWQGGTEVLGGTLQVNNTTGSGTGTGIVTVAAGATLGGTGTIAGATTVNGALAPGASVGKLTFGAGGLTLGTLTAGSLKYELGAPTTAGTTYDSVDTSSLAIGTGVLNFASFLFTDTGTLAAGTYTLISSAAPITGTLGASLSGPIGSFTGTLSISGNNLVLTVTGGALPPYDTWAAGFSGFTPTAPALDFDNDGLQNLLEFVLGGDPRVNDTPTIRPAVTSSGTDLVVTFKRSDLSELAPAVTVRVQTSLDLVSWTDFATIGATSGSGYTVDETGSLDTIVVTIPKAAATKKFARVIATN